MKMLNICFFVRQGRNWNFRKISETYQIKITALPYSCIGRFQLTDDIAKSFCDIFNSSNLFQIGTD